MWIMIILALVASLSILQSGVTDRLARENPVEARQSMTELATYQTFAFAASRYMENIKPTPPAPGSRIKVTWDEIRESDWTPPASRNVRVPKSWYVELAGSGDYVLCAQLSHRAIAAIGQYMPDTYELYHAAPGSSDKMVFSDSQDNAQSMGSVACTDNS